MNKINDTRDRTLFFLLLLALGLTALLSLARIACGDEIEAARQRLRRIESEHKAAEVPAPVPDPISARRMPEIRFEISSSAAAERLPRAVLVVGQYCSPCLRIERECDDLIGGPEAPIQLVRNWLANDLDKWGVTPGMQTSTPVIFILDKDGKVHGLTVGGLNCLLRGYQSRDTILKYLAQPEHGVSIVVAEPPAVLATVEHADASPETFAAVLAAHLAESSGQKNEDEPFAVGGLFDFSVDVPESWKSIGLKILTAQKIEFSTAGITVDWSGQTRAFTVQKDSLLISPPVRVQLKKWFISYSAALDGVKFAPDLSTVTVLLTGAPDLTVSLK